MRYKPRGSNRTGGKMANWNEPPRTDIGGGCLLTFAIISVILWLFIIGGCAAAYNALEGILL